MGQMTGNTKNKSLIGSEELGATDKTVSFDASVTFRKDVAGWRHLGRLPKE
jgi:hypothetical protein